jgi:hypothetical protein
MNKFTKYFGTANGFVVIALAAFIVLSLPVIIGTYVTKAIVKKCSDQSMGEFTTRFENTRNFLIIAVLMFEVVAAALIFKLFNVGGVVMDPILSYPIKYGRRQMRGWILVLIFMALFFLGIYGTSLLMAKPIAGERRRDESEMDHFNKVQDSYVGAVFIVIGIALVMGFVIARLSRPE